MLTELQQLLTCRRERENRAAAALQRARLTFDRARAAVGAAEVRLEDHQRSRRLRQDKLYRRTLRDRLSKREIDTLNIELDLMAEEAEALAGHVRDAEALAEQAKEDAEQAASAYRRHRLAADRWGHLVDDVAETHRRRQEQAEEFAIEDDLGDRRTASQGGLQ
ncbi:MAG: type III secretion system stalk subunit SctO [Geminicoccaceae bacterium]